MIRHRACAMRDLAHAIIDSDLEPQFEKQCLEIVESRNRRGIKLDQFAPKYQRVLPKNLMIDPSTGNAIPKPVIPVDVQKPKPKPHEARHETGHSTPRKKRLKRSSWSRGVIRSARKKKIDTQCDLSSNNESSILENSVSIVPGDADATALNQEEEESTSDSEKAIIENGVADAIVVEDSTDVNEMEESDSQIQACDENDGNSEEPIEDQSSGEPENGAMETEATDEGCLDDGKMNSCTSCK